MSRTTKMVSAVTVLSTAGLTLAACGGEGSGGQPGTEEAVRGGTLNVLGAGDVDYMDPNVSYYSTGYSTLRLWSRQLLTFPAVGGKTTTAVPDLATELPTESNGGISSDGKTYTIKMRSDAQWNTSPARTVTADDAVRGVKRTCNPVQPFGGIPDFADLIVGYQKFCDGFAKAGQSPADMAEYVEKTPLPGVVAKDPQTVVFKLTRPATYFIDMLALPAFSPAPEEFLKYAPGSAELAQHTISDGPYTIDSYKPTKGITFSRNPAWKEGSDPVRKAYVDQVVVNETVSQESVQQQLQTGTPSADLQYDVAVPASKLPKLMATKDPNLVLGETFSTNPYIVFNEVSPNNAGALGKVKVRQALSYALDRDNILQVLGGPKINPPLTHILPPGIEGSTNFDPYPHDVAKAKALLKEAGYPNGLTLKFLYRNSTEASSKTFQTVQQDLKAAGITVKGVPSPNADFYTKYLQVPSVAKRGVWDLSASSWGPDWYGNAAVSFFQPLLFGKSSFPPVGSNFGFYDNDAAQSKIQQAASATQRADAEKLWAEADKLVMDDAPIYPLTSPKWASYHASQVKNAVFIPAFQNFDMANVWLPKDQQGG